MKNKLRSVCLSLAAVGAFAGLPALSQAQNAAPGTDARVSQERARCDGRQQDRAACLREAGAAQQEARRDGLSTPGAQSKEQNELARCQMQPVADRADCETRIKGTGRTTSEGSVMGGGVIRETVTPVPAPATAR
jgi:hypothetical protein